MRSVDRIQIIGFSLGWLEAVLERTNRGEEQALSRLDFPADARTSPQKNRALRHSIAVTSAMGG
jgi:hypothetical protein